MKWVTRGSAVLALVFAVIQLVRLVSDTRDRERQIGELTRVEEMQAQAGDYPGAWASLDQALKIAESGGMLSKLTGQLSADARKLREAQEDVAMAWVENLSHGEGKTFSEVDREAHADHDARRGQRDGRAQGRSHGASGMGELPRVARRATVA